MHYALFTLLYDEFIPKLNLNEGFASASMNFPLLYCTCIMSCGFINGLHWTVQWHFKPPLWMMLTVCVTGSHVPWMEQRWRSFKAHWLFSARKVKQRTKGFSGRCGYKLHTISLFLSHTHKEGCSNRCGESSLIPSHHWVAAGNHLPRMLTISLSWISLNSHSLILFFFLCFTFSHLKVSRHIWLLYPRRFKDYKYFTI